MYAQTDKSWRDASALNQNWSYQPTLAGRAIVLLKLRQENLNMYWKKLSTQNETHFVIFH